jgi:hypothetical protein
VKVQIGIAIGIEIETFREKFDCDFDPDPDPDPERTGGKMPRSKNLTHPQRFHALKDPSPAYILTLISPWWNM